MIKVHIAQQPWNNTLSLYITERPPLGRAFCVLPMKMEMRELQQGDQVEPSLQIPGEFAEELFRALAEALDQRGVKTDSDAKLAGTIEAMRLHMDDLRTLLKLKGKP